MTLKSRSKCVCEVVVMGVRGGGAGGGGGNRDIVLDKIMDEEQLL